MSPFNHPSIYLSIRTSIHSFFYPSIYLTIPPSPHTDRTGFLATIWKQSVPCQVQACWGWSDEPAGFAGDGAKKDTTPWRTIWGKGESGVLSERPSSQRWHSARPGLCDGCLDVLLDLQIAGTYGLVIDYAPLWASLIPSNCIYKPNILLPVLPFPVPYVPFLQQGRRNLHMGIYLRYKAIRRGSV